MTTLMEDLVVALTKHLPSCHTLAEQELRSAFDEEELVAFNVTTGFHLSEEGSTAWNEVAVIADKRLILLNVEELSASARENMPSPDISVDVAMQVFPLRTISRVLAQRAYTADGELRAVNATVILPTLDSSTAHAHGDPEVDEVPVMRQHYALETLQFVANSEDSSSDVERCGEFLNHLVRLVH